MTWSCPTLELASEPIVIVVGSEGKGLSRLVRETCDQIVSVPMSSAVESLNAGIATGVTLYEVARRRSALRALPAAADRRALTAGRPANAHPVRPAHEGRTRRARTCARIGAAEGVRCRGQTTPTDATQRGTHV